MIGAGVNRGMGWRRTWKKLFLLYGVSCLSGCSVANDTPLAEAGVTEFHRKLDAGQFDAIYAGSAQELKASATQTEMNQLLSAIHRKLGNFVSGSSKGWNDSVTTNGHFLTLNYAAKFAGGPADETFVYRIDGGRAVLAGYHINSMALIVK